MKEGTTIRHRLPEWLRRESSASLRVRPVKEMLRSQTLHTVCEEARCPNIGECFSQGTATFMILGDVCTRGCRFCAVTTGKPLMPASSFAAEGERVADAAARLALSHVVVTSVARDDLPDGGSSGFVATIDSLRRRLPDADVEVLIPDFRRKEGALDTIIAARPDVLNHNLETIPRLYREVRPGASYQGSLTLLARVKEVDPSIYTKTGIMVGLGETEEEVHQVMRDAAAHGVDIFTIGQYMQPTRHHLPVARYVTPLEFDAFAEYARQQRLFSHVFSGPLVRSSYHAGEGFSRSREQHG